ncbi:MAG: hypothetical protein KDD35_03240 [Bdellovibrionales bacterium]|nr:hypothetical protein [Bdellovibrionales bacterium]
MASFLLDRNGGFFSLSNLGVLVLVYLVFSSLETKALNLRIADFDGTIVEERRSLAGAMKTKFRLFLRKEPISALQLPSQINLPPFIDVTPIDLHRVRDYLSQEDGVVGSVGKKFNLEEGQSLEASQYHLKNPDSFWRFFDDPLGFSNYLLDDFKLAERLVAETVDDERPLSFKGPYWDEFVQAMSTPESAAATIIITARGHDRNTTWVEFFEYLKSRNYIANVPTPEHIHGVSRLEYSHFGMIGEIAKKKAEVLKKHLLQLVRISPEAKDFQRSPDGDSFGRYHLVTIAEDNQDILNAYIKVIEGFARSQIAPLKFRIFNAGTTTEIRASGRPAIAILTSSGGFRREKQEFFNDSDEYKNIPLGISCREKLQ